MRTHRADVGGTLGGRWGDLVTPLGLILGRLLSDPQQRGCDVNGQSYSGNTALHGACGRGQVDVVRLLLKSGADSSLKNYHNDTPVMVTRNKKASSRLSPLTSHAPQLGFR